MHGSWTHRQSCHRHRLEPRARAGQRARAGRRRLPRVPLRARRGAAGRSRASRSRRRRSARTWSPPCRPTSRPTPAIALVIERTVETFGGLDILVNNVGRAGGSDMLDTTDAEWQAAFDETLFPAIRASRLAVPHMKQRGGGAIIMIASIWGRESGGRMTYNAVKAAEISLAKALAQQLAPSTSASTASRPDRSCSPAARGTSASRPIPRHRRVRQARAAVRPLRPRRRSRRRRRVPRLAARQLDQRRLHRRRRLPVPIEHLECR